MTRCPMPIIRRDWADDGSDTYTDVIEQCDGDLIIKLEAHTIVDSDGYESGTVYWKVECTESGHVVLVPYDDTNGPTVPAEEVDAPAMIARFLESSGSAELNAARKVVETAKVILEHWHGCNSSWEAKDQWNAPMAENVERTLREAVEAVEALA